MNLFSFRNIVYCHMNIIVYYMMVVVSNMGGNGVKIMLGSSYDYYPDYYTTTV